MTAYCPTCREIKQAREGFCVSCGAWLGPVHPTLTFHKDAFAMVWRALEPK